ncbi:MAG: GntR family transcriptional regulator [Acutalibacteraceae bacterium]|jgi:GntR family transcriptional regulator|nr:GntR family transcriptional regulator [Clostridia bacterium]MEE1292319.1 GntR family transcriptional regulator [Acutalibacteraceae bacterium]NLD29132.1 GntR family transcriptional regulator [Clostridiales bacterium]MBQ1314541.1 GntR family transcriptional regulator [Clostridia bacterium]MBQ1528785.1 GntR family transcriptional regulator [Clostridia bacterium]
MFTIDNMSRIPVYEQIVEQTERMLLSGEMKPGDPMPSVRGLAAELGVNPNTIQKAYTELEHRGMTTSVPGRGSFLREDATEQLVAYLNETALPEFKNMLKGMLIAGASKEESLVFIEKILDELADELDA